MSTVRFIYTSFQQLSLHTTGKELASTGLTKRLPVAHLQHTLPLAVGRACLADNFFALCLYPVQPGACIDLD
jgi:hypothetical protein